MSLELSAAFELQYFQSLHSKKCFLKWPCQVKKDTANSFLFKERSDSVRVDEELG